jgi:hypothetical protein
LTQKSKTISFELAADAYWPIRDEATSLSEEAKAVIRSATGVPETTKRRVESSRPVAEEIRDWFRDHARGYLEMEGHRHKATACQRAAEAIQAALQ